MTGSEFADRYAKLRDNERNGDPDAKAEIEQLIDAQVLAGVKAALREFTHPTAAAAADREVA